MPSIKKATEEIKSEFDKPIPDHKPEKEKKVSKSKKKTTTKPKAKAKTSAKGKTKETKKKKVTKATEKDNPLISITELAEEAGISTTQARQRLRAAKIERQEGKRWEWAPSARALKAVRKALGLK